MTPLRICMRLNNAFTHDLRVRREAEALVEAGYEVTVVADFRPGQGLAEEEVRRGVRVRRVAKTSAIPYWSLVRPLLDERADIYHAHDIDSLFPCLAAARLGRRNAKVIYDSHELWSGHAADKVHGRRRTLIRYEGPMLRACDGLVTASPAYTETIVSRHRYTGPARTVLNVPVSRSDEELQPHWAVRDADDRVRVAAVGVFQHGRGAVPLIESLDHLPEQFVVELIGPVPQPDYEELMRDAAVPFGERVHFAGAIPADEVIPRLAASHISAVLIEPLSESYRLTAPNKLFDSLMAGTPIVGSDMKVIGDVEHAENAGEVCDVSSPADIARAVLAAYENRDAYGRAARAAAKRYNWESEQQNLLSLYEEVAGGPRC